MLSNDELIDNLVELSTLYGPSGEEQNIAKYLVEKIGPYVDETYIDENNNFIGVKKGGDKILVIDAHIDEIEPDTYYSGPHITNNQVIGRAMDNRAGCAALIEIAKNSKNDSYTIYFVGTSKEELGFLGAKEVVEHIINREGKIDLSITLDVISTSKKIYLGKGVTLMEISEPPPKEVKLGLTKKTYECAELFGVPYQISDSNYGTDLASTDGYIYYKKGAECTVISIPCENVHSIPERIDLKDLEGTIKLTTNLINTL
jgi:endoglucanase